MTTHAPAALPARRLQRRGRGRLFGGVASGIADHLGVRPAPIRAAFFLLTLAGGFGVVLYAAYWIVLPTAPDGPPSRIPAWLEYLAAGVVGVGSIFGVTQVSSFGRLLVPAMLGCLGAALIWRQAGDAQRRRWADWSRSSVRDAGGLGRVRLFGGIALIVVGAALIFATTNISAAGQSLLAVTVTLVGVALVTGPWWLRMVDDLNAERRARITSQARADLAAHLHDSVLQTLALIQRNADAPREVTRLARGQERELRALLYGPLQATGQLSEALQAAAGEVEDAYVISVDTVLVGDAPMSERLGALVAASREAMVNAAKHAGVTSVSLYGEVEDGAATVYVKDRGVGFDVAAIAEDRQGVRGSIISRVERHGGVVNVRSTPGSGTEIEIRMPTT